MDILEVLVIAIALAMDALGVTIGIGLNSILKRKHKIKFVISFTFFQFFLTYLGGTLGHLFDLYIASISNIAGGIIISIIGILMLIEGFKKEETKMLIKNTTCIILGISVSIDALVVGFTAFHNIKNNLLLGAYSVLVGLITMLICSMGFFSCKYIKKINIIANYANFLGGIALIFFGAKMILL